MSNNARVALLKKAIRNLRSDMDASLSDREKELLKELIVKGQVQTEADLRGYLNRMSQARKRQAEQNKLNLERRRDLQEKQKREEERQQGQQGQQDQQGKSEASAGPGAAGEMAKQETPDAKAPHETKDPMAEPAKLVGKVICAKTRRPLPYVRVRVQGESYNDETEGSGVFIYENLTRGEPVQMEMTLKGYKPLLLQFKATLDNEQNVVVKMVPLDGQKKKKKIEF